MPRIVSIEGNIASGKSTLLNRMRAQYKTMSGVEFVAEPVNQWRTITDAQGEDMLTKFYANPARYSFAFQMMAYISRLSLLRRALSSGADIVFTERSVLTDRNVFASMLRGDGTLEEAEFKIYTRWFDEFISDIPEPEIVYVRTDPEICVTRAAARGRKGETVPLPYLTKVHERHENWLMGQSAAHRMLTLNANVDTTSAPSVVEEWLRAIESFVWGNSSLGEAHVAGRLLTGAPESPPGVQPRSGWLLQTDGASRGNPGPCGAGWVLFHDGIVISEGSQYLSDNGTNNWAEYQALLGGLVTAQQKCPRFGCEPLQVEADSLLVVNQVNGEWSVKMNSLKRLREDVLTTIERLGRVDLRHIKRELNSHADRLANKAIDDHERTQAVSRS